MTTNELRIGNWVRYGRFEDHNYVDKQITIENLQKADHFDPTPLTPEILEKAGFKKDQYLDGFSIEKMYGVLIEQDTGWKVYDQDGSYLNSNNPVKHLHQLQNLYYCLTGEELTIEL